MHVDVAVAQQRILQIGLHGLRHQARKREADAEGVERRLDLVLTQPKKRRRGDHQKRREHLGRRVHAPQPACRERKHREQLH